MCTKFSLSSEASAKEEAAGAKTFTAEEDNASLSFVASAKKGPIKIMHNDDTCEVCK